MITISRQIGDRRRKRFSIAHELGHMELREWLVSTWCLKEDIENWRQRANAELETEANQFAAALLMPSKMMAPMWADRDASLDLVRSLTEVFDTSLTATAIRLVDQTTENVVVIMSQAGRVRWFHGSSTFNELSSNLGLFIDIEPSLTPTPSQQAYIGAWRFLWLTETPKHPRGSPPDEFGQMQPLQNSPCACPVKMRF